MGSLWCRRRLVLLIICVLQPMLPISRGCSREERAALMEIRASFARANSTMPPLSWGHKSHEDCCSWQRVKCNNTTRRVSHLDLSKVYGGPNPSGQAWRLDTTVFAAFPELQSLNLSSNSPMALLSFDGFKNLSNLRELRLSSNNISGNLPSFLFSLPHIQVLDLSQNMVEGPIPTSTQHHLVDLDLSNNNLSGRMPKWLFTKRSILVNLNLGSNSLTGFPISTQHNLVDLDLSNNNLSGRIPKWLFTKRSTLVNLNLGRNSLIGHLDQIWYPQTSLQSIDISMNHIAGQLPDNISSIFPSLTDIDVSNNNFSGEIPVSFCHIYHIRNLHLHNNMFSGEMPACMFTDLPNLWILRVSNNHLGGPILGGRNNLSVGFAMHLDGNMFEGELPHNLSGELLIIDLHDNKLTGELDASSWNLSNLRLLNVAGNNMTGEIQPQICALPNIQYLDLSNNHFSGRIRGCNSTSLGSLNMSMNLLSGDVSWEHFNMSNLFNLDVRHNMLTGNLSWVHPFHMIRVLSLGHNEFHGQIPSSLCELRYLRIIDLSHNKLSGPVPLCIGAISFEDSFDGGTSSSWFMLFEVIIYAYMYTTTLTVKGDFTFGTKGMQLTYGPLNHQMSGIDLSGNSLSGKIPWELGNLSHVRSLNLSRNALTGPIPTSLANMSQVESMDLSHNDLTGVIPSELTRLWSLAVFSVAYNSLSGCVPSFGQFTTFGADSYEGNNQLKMDCSTSPSGPILPRDEMVVDAGPYAIGAASFVLAFWATVAFMFCHSIGQRLVLKL